MLRPLRTLEWALLAGLLFCFHRAEAQVIINIPGASGPPGVSGSIILSLTGSSTAPDPEDRAAGVSLDFVYPPAVLATPTCSIDPTLSATGFTLQTNVTASDHVRLLISALDNTTLTITDGPIAVCTARILSTAPLGTYPLAAEFLVVSNTIGRVLPFTANIGQIQVISSGCMVIQPSPVMPWQVVVFLLLPFLMMMGRRLLFRPRSRQDLLLISVCILGVGSPAAADGPAISGSWNLTTTTTATVQHAPLKTADRELNSIGPTLNRALPQPQPVAAPAWQVWDVKSDGVNKATGRLALAGASFLRLGHFTVHLRPGGHFAGVVKNDVDEVVVATIAGKLTSTGVRGTFTTVSGEQGDFTWVAGKAKDFAPARERLLSLAPDEEPDDPQESLPAQP